MIYNYLKIAIRTLIKNKAFSIINIFGLAVSMSVCLLVIMIVAEQFSTDRSNPYKERLYRVNTTRTALERTSSFATTALPVAAELDGITFVEETTTINDGFSGDADTGVKKVPVHGIYAASNVFRLFDLGLSGGDPKTALAAPNSIVLTKKAAEKLYAPGEQVIGRALSFGEFGEFTVTGILDDPLHKTHVDGFEVIISISTIPILEDQEVIGKVSTEWDRYYRSYVYALLKPDIEANELTPYLDNIVATHYSNDDNLKVSLSVQLITAINPAYSELSNELSFSIPVIALVFISGLALLIILTATFNYTNLSIAKSLNRMKEVGIRKVSGARRGQLFFQFIVESILTSLFALILAFGMLQIIRPYFFKIDPHIQEIFSLQSGPKIWLVFFAFAIFVGLLAGALPAFLLSKQRAYDTLKNSSSIKLLSGLNFRKALIVGQFALSLIFITSAIILNRQFEYALNYDLGFDRENILHIELQGNDYNLVATELGRTAGINDIAGLGYVMGVGRLYTEYAKNPDLPDSISLGFQPITPNYTAHMGHEFLAGEGFPATLNDSTETFIILNETAVRELQLGSVTEAIGKTVILEENSSLQVIGVVEDFHYNRISGQIGPYAFRYIPEDFRVINLKLSAGNIEQTMAGLEVAWTKLDNVHEFDYAFYDEQIAEAYSIFSMLNVIIGFFAFLAVTISVLGLLGMVIYSTQSRLKEVGIRKVLGAETGGLMWLLSKGFAGLLLLAVVIAVPVSVLLNNAWLQEMVTRAPISFGDMASGVAIMLALGLMAVISQTYITTLQNPSDTLRDE